MQPPNTINALLDSLNVSRETFPLLEQYAALLTKWNKKINLVAPSTIDELWTRHIIDSLQLLKYIPNDTKNLADFGSGGGLPAIILAFCNAAETIHLIESDHRKTAFLTQCSTLSPENISIHTDRVEKLTPWENNVLTARAFAPMNKLLGYTFPFMAKNCLSLFLKGCNVETELQDAKEHWDFSYELHPSITSDSSYIVAIRDVKPRGK